MNTTAIMAAALLGFTWGYQPLDDQKMEYIVQLRPEELKVLADGTHEIISKVPPEAQPIGCIRIFVGDEKLPRKPLPKPLHRPGNGTQPATALDRDRTDGMLEWPNMMDSLAGQAEANSIAPADGYRPYHRPWMDQYHSQPDRWSSVVPPIRPGPADDSASDSRWLPPLAQPYTPRLTDLNDGRFHEIDTPPNDSRPPPPLNNPPLYAPDTVYNNEDRSSSGSNEQPYSNGFSNTRRWDDGSTNPITPDPGSLVSVPPVSERGRGIGYSDPETGVNRSEVQKPKWDWSKFGNGETSVPNDPNTAQNETNTKGDKQETQPKAEPSPSTENKPLNESNPDESPWRTWTLLLGPIAIALGGLNVYQWGIYKSVRRRYLALLRKAGEV